MLTAVLLEIEDVLVETAPARAAALARALAEEGVAGDPARALDARPLDATTLDATTLDATARELVTLRAGRHFAASLADGVRLVPGARAGVERLAARVPVAVVTRATRREAEMLLGLGDLQDLFAFVMAADDPTPGPAAAPYERARRRLAARLGARASERGIVALESARPGIEAAAAAGLAVVAVGAVPAHEALRASGAVDSLEELTVEQLERVAGLAAGHTT